MTYWTDLLGKSFSVNFIDVGGVRTRAMTMGRGDPVIFLHGISGHLEAFVPVAPHLSDNYQLHLIDMLAHGYTDKPKKPLLIAEMADHVVAYMDACGIAKAHLVGISLGGWVAGWLAAKRGDRCLSSILIAAAGSPGMGRPEVAEHVRRITLAGVMSEDKQDTWNRIRAVMFSDATVDDELVETRFRVYHEPDFRANIENLLALTEVDNYNANSLTPDLLGKIEAEILLCWGEDDKKAGVSDAAFLLDHLPKSRLIEMAGTGHWPPYERPADFARIADAFFKRGLSAVEAGPQ